MEIRFLNVIGEENNKFASKRINIRLKSTSITGIYGDLLERIPSLLTRKKEYLGNIKLNDTSLLKSNKLIVYIGKLHKDTFLTRTVSDEFYLMSKYLKINDKEYLEKIKSSLKMVGLNKNYLKREIKTLSRSEKRLIQIALSLIINPEVILINEPFLYLTKDNRFSIKKVLLDLCNKYEKMVIILSQDVNVLYEMTKELIMFKDNQVLASGNTNFLLKDTAFLEKNKINVPDLVLFNKIALTYDQKLPDYNEVNDLIKGVYYHVLETKDQA